MSAVSRVCCLVIMLSCFHRLAGLTRQCIQSPPLRLHSSKSSVRDDVGNRPRAPLLKSLKNKRIEQNKEPTKMAPHTIALEPAVKKQQPKPFTSFNNNPKEVPLGRPFTLPAGLFKPKQSLGQNFLNDKNYVIKICDAFSETSTGGSRVVEIGPGPGSLTKTLFPRQV